MGRKRGSRRRERGAEREEGERETLGEALREREERERL